MSFQGKHVLSLRINALVFVWKQCNVITCYRNTDRQALAFIGFVMTFGPPGPKLLNQRSIMFHLNNSVTNQSRPHLPPLGALQRFHRARWSLRVHRGRSVGLGNLLGTGEGVQWRPHALDLDVGCRFRTKDIGVNAAATSTGPEWD